MEFKSFEEAVAALEASEPDSPEWREALAYAVDKAPAPLKAIFDDLFRQFFPDLKPDFYDDQGNPYWEVEKTRKYFDVSREEVEELREKHPDMVKTSEGLKKVQ